MSHGCSNCQTMETTFNTTIKLLREQRETALDQVVQEKLMVTHLQEQLTKLQIQFSKLTQKEAAIMSTDEQQIEAEIQSKNLNAPRLTPEHIDAQIVTAAYHVFPGTTMMVCCLTLRNGFNTIGHSAAASPDNFDEAIGQKIAYKNAREQIWALEGYLLREKLSKTD